MNSQYGGENKSAVDYIISPWNISVTAQPEDARVFDGVIGVAFIIGLPLLGFAFWKFELPVEVRICAGVAGIMFLFWLFSSQQLRYLLPIVPLLAIAIVAAAGKVSGTLRSATTSCSWRQALLRYWSASPGSRKGAVASCSRRRNA